MDEMISRAIAVARGIWRRRWTGVAVAWAIGIVAALALVNMPDRFEATARIYVDTKTILKPLMKDLTVEPDMDQTVGMLARTLITRPNVELLLSKSFADSASMSAGEKDVLVETLTKRIKLTGSGHDNVFSFSFRDTDPQRARMVVQNLVSLFLDSDSTSTKRDSDEARTFIDEQIKNYETRLTEAENRLKEFKLRNMGIGDASGKDYFSRISALTEEAGKLRTELRAGEESRDALKRELATEDPVLVAEAPVAVVVPPTPTDPRLETQRRLLDDLLRRYTEAHPDVVATRKLIARLEEQQQNQQVADEAARAKAAEHKPPPRVSASTNPVFQKLKVSYADAESNVAALRVRVSDTQARLAQLRASASRVPQIEAELAQLNRDYDVVRRQYEALVGRREKASISENVDATRLTSFRVIEPPRTAPQPVFPNRMLLAPMVLLLALAGGVGASYLVSQLLPSFANARELMLLTKRPVLGSVSMLVSDAMRRRNRVDAVAACSALAGLVLVYGAWIAWMTVVGRA
jgi:polysaccharide chain length determinant protein (PEP-CTERM system associated)